MVFILTSTFFYIYDWLRSHSTFSGCYYRRYIDIRSYNLKRVDWQKWNCDKDSEDRSNDSRVNITFPYDWRIISTFSDKQDGLLTAAKYNFRSLRAPCDVTMTSDGRQLRRLRYSIATVTNEISDVGDNAKRSSGRHTSVGSPRLSAAISSGYVVGVVGVRQFTACSSAVSLSTWGKVA